MKHSALRQVGYLFQRVTIYLEISKRWSTHGKYTWIYIFRFRHWQAICWVALDLTVETRCIEGYVAVARNSSWERLHLFGHLQQTFGGCLCLLCSLDLKRFEKIITRQSWGEILERFYETICFRDLFQSKIYNDIDYTFKFYYFKHQIK